MDTETLPILEVKNLAVEIDGRFVLENVSFKVQKNDVLAIVGPNGAGKSTLFRALLGLIKYTGYVKWGPNINIGYVPQKLSFEHDFPLSVREFLQLKTKFPISISAALDEVGLKKHIAEQSIGSLSGGELQRIMIAWALLGNPNILLFDEPTAGIDIGGEETIYNLLHKLQDSHELTVLLISHDLNIVYQYANNVICLNKRMICYGEPNTVLDPKGLAELYGGKPKFFHHEHGTH